MGVDNLAKDYFLSGKKFKVGGEEGGIKHHYSILHHDITSGSRKDGAMVPTNTNIFGVTKTFKDICKDIKSFGEYDVHNMVDLFKNLGIYNCPFFVFFLIEPKTRKCYDHFIKSDISDKFISRKSIKELRASIMPGHVLFMKKRDNCRYNHLSNEYDNVFEPGRYKSIGSFILGELDNIFCNNLRNVCSFNRALRDKIGTEVSSDKHQ